MTPALLATLGALGLAGTFLVPGRRLRALSLLAVGVSAVGLLAWLPSSGDQLARRWPLVIAGGVIGLVVAASVGRALFARPLLLLSLLVIAIPIRVPIGSVGADGGRLLVPLYALLACCFVALLLDARTPFEQPTLGPLLGIPLSLFLFYAAISLSWSADAANGAKSFAFFVLPFGLLAAVLARFEPDVRRLTVMLRVQSALAVLFTLVGLYQWLFETVWWNRKLMISNEFSSFFRVNSVFYDPSIFGRYLAVSIALVVAALLFQRVRSAGVAAGAVGVIWLGLLVSYSQSSLFALSAGVALALLLALGRRVALPLGLAAILVGAAMLIVPGVSSSNLDKITSNRSNLASSGLSIYRSAPIVGVGFGGSAVRGGKRIQHVLPLTIASELGTIGLLLFGLVVCALARIALFPDETRRRALGIGIAVILVHSPFYAAFFEDPLTWGLIGLLAACARPGIMERQ